MTDIAEIAAEIAAQKLLRYPFSTISTANGEALLTALEVAEAKLGDAHEEAGQLLNRAMAAEARVAELETKVEGFLSASIHIEIVARWKAAEAEIARLRDLLQDARSQFTFDGGTNDAPLSRRALVALINAALAEPACASSPRRRTAVVDPVLLPCPACHQTKGEMQEYSGGDARVPIIWHNATCIGCGFTAEAAKTKSLAIAAWNTRAPVEAARPKAGWKLVPIEPTADMARAAYKAWDAFGEDATLGPTEVVAIWRAMVAAAAPEPTP